MTGYEILTRDTAILTSKNVGHASNFFFCWHTQCFGHVKSGCPRVENREKSQKIAKRVQIRWSLFTTCCPPYTFGPELTAVEIWGSGFSAPGTGIRGPHILSVLSSRPLKYGGSFTFLKKSFTFLKKSFTFLKKSLHFLRNPYIS